MKNTRWWLGLGAASCGAGILAQWLRLPGGWLIGPLLVALVIGLTRPGHPRVPAKALHAAQAVIGLLIAGIFRPAALPLLAAHWMIVAAIVFLTLAISFSGGFLLSKFTEMDRGTAALGTLPGGASSMIAASISLGVDTRMVALMQYVRLVLVVITASLLARFVLHPSGMSSSVAPPTLLPNHLHWTHDLLVYGLTAALAGGGSLLGLRLRFPAGALLGPLVLGLTAALAGHVHPAWPPGVPEAAYMVVGVYVGLLFDRESVRQAGRLVPIAALTTLVLMILCAAMGAGLAVLTHTQLLTGYLATTPGGMDTITVVALGSGADVSLILALQLARLIAIMVTGPLLTQFLIRRKGQQKGERGPIHGSSEEVE